MRGEGEERGGEEEGGNYKFSSSSQVYPVAMATLPHTKYNVNHLYGILWLFQVPLSHGATLGLHTLPFTPTSPGLLNSIEQQMLVMPRHSVGMLSALEEPSYLMTRSHASQVRV